MAVLLRKSFLKQKLMEPVTSSQRDRSSLRDAALPATLLEACPNLTILMAWCNTSEIGIENP